LASRKAMAFPTLMILASLRTPPASLSQESALHFDSGAPLAQLGVRSHDTSTSIKCDAESALMFPQ
jgi:hypothetical protein